MFIDTRGLFDINPHLKVKVVEKEGIKVLVVDDFYKTPGRIKKFIESHPAPIWKSAKNSHNFSKYYDCRHTVTLPFDELSHAKKRIQDIIQEHFGISVALHDNKLVTNIFQNIDNSFADKDIVTPHNDGDAFPAIIYFNKNKESVNTGTAIYKLKAFDAVDSVNSEEIHSYIEKHKLEECGINYYLPHWQEHWEEFLFIPAKYNRLVIIKGSCWHSAKHSGSDFIDAPRINQVLFTEQN